MHFCKPLIWLAIFHENYILLEENRGGVHNPDKERVNVILEVCDLLALALHRALEPDQHFDEVLKTQQTRIRSGSGLAES